jgi:site-specific DNA-methyltransferase (adenine-specific)
MGGNATITPIDAGRWPANVVLDEEAAARLDGEVGDLPGRGNVGPSTAIGPAGAATVPASAERPSGAEYTYGDTGGASRFFYTAKASRSEREAGLGPARAHVDPKRKDGSAGRNSPRAGAGRQSKRANTHPTVKPIDLMQWLVRLVTPPGGIVLDPFTGSGTTGCAAALEGFEFAGAEMSATYAEIARARIEHWRLVAVERSRQLPLFDPPEPRPRAEQTGLDFDEAAE